MQTGVANPRPLQADSWAVSGSFAVKAPQQGVLANPNTIGHRGRSQIIRDEVPSQAFVGLANLVWQAGDPREYHIAVAATLGGAQFPDQQGNRSEEHTSELQSL